MARLPPRCAVINFAAPAGRFLTLGADVRCAGSITWCGQGGADHGALGVGRGRGSPAT